MADQTNNSGLEDLLLYLKQNRSFDFTGYKRSSLTRRLERRMTSVGAETFEEYQDYLEVHPREFELLFNTILINFTGFFRDAEAWTCVADEIIPKILTTVPPEAPIRVWSAGCASGEEAYTIAMLFAEAMGADDFRQRLKIYATDVDEDALNQARHAVYSERAVQAVPDELRSRYFELLDDRYVFRKDLRRTLVFGRHDLMRDAPISRLDLLMCRNVLIYFNRHAQRRIITNFHFALNEAGYLFLGRSEMLLAQDNLFEAASVPHRIFRKVADVRLRDRMLMLPAREAEQEARSRATTDQLSEMAFESSPAAQVVVDSQGAVVLTNRRAQQLFDLRTSDHGRPFRDLELSYRPVELRSVIDRAQSSNSRIRMEDVERLLPDGQSQYFDIEVTALTVNEDVRIGTHISFMEVTSRHLLRRELLGAKQIAETMNEELQSTNEELETSNEELQSTNEEMETVNEELQSTNEELQSVNEELREATLKADRVSIFLESILASVEAGIVVIDHDYRILLWNDQATEFWGLRPDEVRGRSLLDLNTGLPVEKLVDPLKRLRNNTEVDQQQIVLDAINRRGQPVRMRITMRLRRTEDPHSHSVVLVMDEEARA